MRMATAEDTATGNHSNGDVDTVFDIHTFDARVSRSIRKSLYYPGLPPRNDPDYSFFYSGPAPQKDTNHRAGRVHVRGAKRKAKRK
ncbi:MAG: hypothetical protein ACYTFK_12930 [Planctomycetota bacterium]|jgi:hypothetical protein